jgi:hypothetical protein
VGIATTFTAGQKLTAAQLNLKPALHVYQLSGATQSILNNTPTVITFTGELLDTINGHSTVTNTSRYTPPVPGHYQCIGMVAMTGATSGPFLANFWKNGAAQVESKYSTEHAVNQASLANTCMAESVLFLNGSTDFVELVVQHFFGSTQSTSASATNGGSYMTITWIAP